MFAMNFRNNLFPNLWCFCKVNIGPVIISCEEQQVASKTLAISAVYASTNYIKRRQLWSPLSHLQSQ